MVSEESILRVEKEKAEEVSLLSDNENNEIKIHHGNNGDVHFPNTWKMKKPRDYLKESQMRFSLLIWPKKSNL